MSEKFTSGLLKSLGKGGWLLLALALACGVLLMYFGGAEKAVKTPDDTAELEARTREVEAKIKALCESTQGAGKTTVAVTLGSSGEKVYSVSSGMSGGDPVCLSETAPQINGIGIVCEGGGDPVVAGRLIALVSAAWNVPTSRICVASAEKNTHQS